MAHAALAERIAAAQTPRVVAVAEAALPDGSRKRLVVVGERLTVRRVCAGVESEVFATVCRDQAVEVYEALDGKERNWHAAYGVRGTHGDPAGKAVAVLAVGATPEDCLAAFLDTLGEELDPASVGQLAGGDEKEFQWGRRFRDKASGTSFKAAGRNVPGGCVMTWWK